jgi:hypothetical protein
VFRARLAGEEVQPPLKIVQGTGERPAG